MTVDEEVLDDDRVEEFCELYNEIAARPDGEIVLQRACAILRILADGPVEGAQETDWPVDLEC